MQIGIGRRRLVVEMIERAAPAPAAPAPWANLAAEVDREARLARLHERDRATARALGWWYGLYGTGR